MLCLTPAVSIVGFIVVRVAEPMTRASPRLARLVGEVVIGKFFADEVGHDFREGAHGRGQLNRERVVEQSARPTVNRATGLSGLMSEP